MDRTTRSFGVPDGLPVVGLFGGALLLATLGLASIPSATNAGSTAVRFTFDRAGDGPLTAQHYKATTELFRGLGRCSASGVAGKQPCVAFEGCSQPYVECGYSGLGHALPPGWASDTWQFFASF